MSDEIELQSFNISGVQDFEIEEYHEIDFGGAGDATVSLTSSKRPQKNIKDYDFFTSQNNQGTHSMKKKSNKKKDDHTDIMDLVNTELATSAIPIQRNVIEIISENGENHLEKWTKRFQLRRFGDSERGLQLRSDAVKLAPIFPKVLESTAFNIPDIPVQYVSPIKFDDTTPISSECSEKVTKFLNIEIKNVKYKYHHLFSFEILLCSKLLAVFEEYTSVQNVIKDVARNIKVNRFTRQSLKQEFARIGENSQKDLRFDSTVRKYTEALFSLKEEYFKILQKQKKIIHEMTLLWSDIEIVREKSGKTETPYELEIIKYTKEVNEYDNEWLEYFNLEIADMLDKLEYDYVTSYLEYKRNKAVPKENKPKKPKLEIDENEVRNEAEKITNEVVKKENKRYYLKHSKNMSGKTKNLFKICFKFYVDNIFVCESENFLVTKQNVLLLNFQESFSVQILPNNTTLTIGLCEDSKEVAGIKIDLKSLSYNNRHNESITKHFFYNYEAVPNAKYIGSGHTIKEIAKANKTRLKSSNLFKETLDTSCEVEIFTSWDGSLNKNDMEDIKTSLEIGTQIKRLYLGTEKPNLDALKKIIQHVYNRDIDTDERLVNQLQTLCTIRSNTDESFPVNESSNYTRLKLLHLRSNGGFLDVENKEIPLLASQISTEQLNCLHRSNQNDFALQYLTDYENADPIELQRFISYKYIQNLNKNMLKNLQEHIFKKTQKDVIQEFQDIRRLLTNQSNHIYSTVNNQQLLMEALTKDLEIQVTVLRGFNLMDRSSSILDEDDDRIAEGYKVHPLRPFVRVSYHGASVQTATGIGCFPTWNQTLRMKIRPNPLSSLFINIYDEYKCNIKDNNSEEEYSTNSRTVHYRFCNRWLGIVEVPLYSVLSLGTVRGTYKISSPPFVFGYENPNQSKDQNQPFLTEVSQLLKKDLSFVTLQLSSSLSTLGGINGYNQPLPGSTEDDYLIKHLNNFVTSYINDFPTRNLSLTFINSSGKNKCVTQFLQPIPLPGYENFPRHPKYRTESAMSKSSGMSKSSSSKSSVGRRKDSDVDKDKTSPLQEEKESLYSGYEATWKEDGQLTKLMNTSLRYVALIPTYEVNNTHSVTLMGLELLKLLHGSPLDHTILLASYFLYLGIKSFVAIGIGLPRGPSSYVITQYDLSNKRVVTANEPLLKKGLFSKTEGYIWYVHDASSGERHELRDASCPLKTVHYVFDSENIWVNIQQSQDCEHVCFDFTKSSDWEPVFDNSIFVMKQPIVTDINLYSTPVDVEALQQTLDFKIRAKVQKWRANTKTVWNRYCSNLLREVLPGWEYWSFNSTDAKPPLGQKLKQLMLTHKVFGFPLNMPFVSTKSVVAAVKSSGVHSNYDPDLEFGLAVQVYAYPNNVFSVWVFLASITRL